MAKFVPDVRTQRWVILSPVRTARPDESHPKPVTPHICPFCEGSEHLTPPEMYRIGDGEKDQKGWRVRVIPNKFPITDTHEVIVHSPHHTHSINEFRHEHVVDLLKVYRNRYLANTKNGHVMIFTNYGFEAGASLTHPHSQLVVIPQQINLDTLVKEPIANIVEDNHSFIVYCPDFSQWPYEIWIAPKCDEPVGRLSQMVFGNISDEEIEDLAIVLKRSIKRLHHIAGTSEGEHMLGGRPYSYNYYIHHDKDWFIRIIPRFVHRAGFELGTGLNVNIIDPTDAAKNLQKIHV